MMPPRVLSIGVVTTVLLCGGAALAGCSDDDDASDDTASSLEMPTTTTATTQVGVTAPATTFLPNTPVVAGQEAILTGTYSQTPVVGATAPDDVCHFVTIDDGTRVSVSFTDTYLYRGNAYPGPADYVGDPEQYEDDPLLVHPDDRIAVRGEVVEVDDPCTASSAHPGLMVLVSTFAPS